MNKSLKSVLALCVVGFNLVGCLQLAEEDKKDCPKCDQNVAGASSTGGSSAVVTSSPATGGDAATGGSSATSSSAATGGDAATGGNASTGGNAATGGGATTLKVDCATKYPNGLPSPFHPENVAADGTNDGTVSFSEQYLPEGSNGYAVGTMPGVGWTAPALMMKSNGRFYYKIPISLDFIANVYVMQYVFNPTVVNGRIPSQYFSPFGKSQEQVACYSAEDKAYIWCNVENDVINGCEFRSYVEVVRGKVKITGAGNLPLVPAGQLF